MSLSMSFDIARSGLATNAEQSSVVSRNIANSSDPNASRKSVRLTTGDGGGVRVTDVVRTANAGLLETVLSSTSVLEGKGATVELLDKIEAVIGGADLEQTPASLVGKLRDALQAYSSDPGSVPLGQAAVSAARDLADGLNRFSQVLMDVRSSADTQLAESVGGLNTLVAKFDDINSAVVRGTHSNKDVTDLLDQRDGLLKSISVYADIRTITRPDNDMVVLTNSGLTLFERVPRSIEFEPTAVLASGAEGGAVRIDGLEATEPGSPGYITSGRIAGLALVRDQYVPTLQRQLDELARAVIGAFSESDQSAPPTLSDRPGLFTYSGAPTVPAAGVVMPGLAGDIKINPNVDPSQGGDIARLRDGAISDPGNPAFIYNATGGSGFSDRIEQLVDAFDVAMPFDASANIGSQATLLGFSSDSYAWLQELRSTSQNSFEYNQVLAERADGSLMRMTGVNIDEEIVSLLGLERSYQASSRLIAVVNEMFGALLAAAG